MPYARPTGIALLLTILIGIASSVLIGSELNINLTGDPARTSAAMATAGDALYAKAWLSALVGALELFAFVGLYLIVREHQRLIAGWGLAMGVLGVALASLGALATLNAAYVFDRPGLLPAPARETVLVQTLVTDYVAFHYALVLNAAAKLAIFWLLLKSRLVPAMIAGWGVFATLFVISMLVGRQFIDALGDNAISMAFILGNLVAHLALGVYLVGWRVREVDTPASG